MKLTVKETFSAKKHLKQWENDKRLKWLEDNPNKSVEAERILKYHALFIKNKDGEALNDIVDGSNIYKLDRYKMRLHEAIFK